jgi:hypothetical protein
MVDFNRQPIVLSQAVINLYIKYGTIRRINGKYISIEEDEIVAYEELKRFESEDNTIHGETH